MKTIEGGSRGAGTTTIASGAPRGARASAESFSSRPLGIAAKESAFSSYIAPRAKSTNPILSGFKAAETAMRSSQKMPDISRKEIRPFSYIAPGAKNKDAVPQLFRDVKRPQTPVIAENRVHSTARRNTTEVPDGRDAPEKQRIRAALPDRPTALPERKTEMPLPSRRAYGIPERRVDASPAKRTGKAPRAYKPAFTTGRWAIDALQKKEEKKAAAYVEVPKKPKAVDSKTGLRKLESWVAVAQAKAIGAVHSIPHPSSIPLPRPENTPVHIQLPGRTVVVKSILELPQLARNKSATVRSTLLERKAISVVSLERPVETVQSKHESRPEAKITLGTEKEVKQTVIFEAGNENKAKDRPAGDDPELLYGKDDQTNLTRLETIKKAWVALMRRLSKTHETPTGKEITEVLPSHPTEELQSELVRGLGIKGDGSYDALVEAIGKQGRIKQIGLLAVTLVEKYTAVRLPKLYVSKRVSKEAVARVLKKKRYDQQAA